MKINYHATHWVSVLLLLCLSQSLFAGSTLAVNKSLLSNQYLESDNGSFRFYLQSDGNLVLRDQRSGSSLWSAATQGKGGTNFKLQSDGNLVLRNRANTAVWTSKTSRSGGVKLAMQNDGNLVLYTSKGQSVWSTGTFQPQPEPMDTVKPVIVLNGQASMSLSQGSAFSDPGATASDNKDGNITSKISVSGSVNSSVAGTYRLDYNVSDAAGNKANTVSRTVQVIATATDTLNAENELVTNGRLTSLNGSYYAVLQGDGNFVLYSSGGKSLWASGTSGTGAVRARMQGDGNFVLRNAAGAAVWSSKTNGTGTVRLKVTNAGNLELLNASGQSVWQAIPPVVVDTTAPVIRLIGASNELISQGSSYRDPGATASDNIDGDISNRIVVSGSVNTRQPATYSLRYNVVDTAGNPAQTVTRTVTVTPASVSNSISMPIEVLGPAGTKKSVSFQLNDTAGISHLYLRCNACGYHDLALDKNAAKTKATVRINGGAAIALKKFTEKGRVYGNAQINVIGGEAEYGGIGGAFRTVRFMVPVTGLKTGENTLTFEHVNPEGHSIGFRIIELNLLQNGDPSNKVLSDAEFSEQDPNEWTAPRPSLTDIDRGEVLWHQRNKLYDASYDLTDGQGNGLGTINGQIRASCSDCHAEDGRDLKYFNFTNESIIARAKFHRLSQLEAEQIASYIRVLDIPVVTQARPWNPTYQPGPGMDQRPVYEWAAGAGIDAILDKDSELAPYLFPKGTSMTEVRAVVDRYKTLNFRELPVNIPMPEWNQWLPLIHPDDAFNTSASAINQDARGRSVGMPFYLKKYTDAKANPTPALLGGLSKDLKAWLQRDLTCVSNGLGNTDPYRAINGAVMTSLRIPFPSVTTSNCKSIDRAKLANIELAKRGLTAWATVKLWEINHSQNLEERSQNVGRSICSSGRCINASETRGWQADGRNVFDRPPHFTGVDAARKYLNQSEMLGIFESNTWYHLNMVINPGYRVSMPSHFAYTYSHIELLQEYSKVNQGYRFWATMIKQRQLQTNGRYGIEAGLDLRTAQPYVYYGTARSTTKTDAQRSVGQPLWGRLATAMVDDFVADANKATAQDWANARGNSAVQSRTSTSFSACSGTCTFDLGPYQGRNTFRVIPELRKIGVEENTIQRLIDWGQKTWPNGPWNQVR